MNILCLTHTDINSDSRILKEMQSIANNFSSCNIYGIGVESSEPHKANFERIAVDSIKLRSRKWRFLPTAIRHFFSLTELSFKMLFRAFKFRPNIIHCNDTMVLPLGVFLKICLGSKIIYDAHELESNRNSLSKSLSKMTLIVEKSLWSFVDELIVVSPSIEKWYKNNIGDKSVTVVLNSPIVNKIPFASNQNYFREKFQIPIDSKIFLYIGALVKGRGIEMIVNSFIYKDVKSHVVFLGYGNLKEALLEISKDFHNIHVHDAVAHDLVVGMSSSADIGLCFIENVSLSDYYCLPNKLFEYCFSGIPVLASNFPDISHVVSKYNLGKCSDLNSESIYNAIKEFEMMHSLPKIDLGSLYDISWGAQEEKLVALYSRLMQKY